MSLKVSLNVTCAWQEGNGSKKGIAVYAGNQICASFVRKAWALHDPVNVSELRIVEDCRMAAGSST